MSNSDWGVGLGQVLVLGTRFPKLITVRVLLKNLLSDLAWCCYLGLHVILQDPTQRHSNLIRTHKIQHGSFQILPVLEVLKMVAPKS